MKPWGIWDELPIPSWFQHVSTISVARMAGRCGVWRLGAGAVGGSELRRGLWFSSRNGRPFSLGLVDVTIGIHRNPDFGSTLDVP